MWYHCDFALLQLLQENLGGGSAGKKTSHSPPNPPPPHTQEPAKPQEGIGGSPSDRQPKSGLGNMRSRKDTSGTGPDSSLCVHLTARRILAELSVFVAKAAAQSSPAQEAPHQTPGAGAGGRGGTGLLLSWGLRGSPCLAFELVVLRVTATWGAVPSSLWPPSECLCPHFLFS